MTSRFMFVYLLCTHFITLDKKHNNLMNKLRKEMKKAVQLDDLCLLAIYQLLLFL